VPLFYQLQIGSQNRCPSFSNEKIENRRTEFCLSKMFGKILAEDVPPCQREIVDADFGSNVHPDSTAARLPSKLNKISLASGGTHL